MVAVLTLLRVLAIMSKWGKRVFKCWKFYHLRSGERLTSKLTALTFLVKDGKMKLSGGVYILRIREKTKKIVLLVVLVP